MEVLLAVFVLNGELGSSVVSGGRDITDGRIHLEDSQGLMCLRDASLIRLRTRWGQPCEINGTA